jgi:peptidoglycan/xylan/chitin deacetylase (PgdA/CDA1 family)
MASHLRLQDVITMGPGDHVQPREFAADIGAYNYVTIQIRVLKAAGAGSIILQHAAVNEESAYKDTTINANAALEVNVDDVLKHGLRFLRWRLSNITGSVTFLIDIIARV